MVENQPKFLVAAGGTGGHLFPAMAVCEQIRLLTEGECEIEFIGTADRIESRVVPKAGYPFHTIEISGLQNIFSLKTLKLPFQVLRAVFKARKIIKEFQPHAVICAGAYLSYPVGIAAMQLNIPVFLMESNAYPGKTILQLAPGARKIFTAFSESSQYFPSPFRAKIEALGNPVRFGFSKNWDKRKARQKFGLNPTLPTVLIFGGSLGARSINEATEQSLASIVANGIQVIWQTGNSYQPSGYYSENVSVLPFIDDMPLAYTAADLVLCRAGATSLAELSQLGKAAILVPYPHAANNHQEENAKVFEQANAALLLKDKTLADTLGGTIIELLKKPELLRAMGEAAKKLGRPTAARDIANAIMQEIEEE